MTLALILVRWVHLSASILLASLFLFEIVILHPAARKLSEAHWHLLETSHRLTCRTALWTLLMAFLSWFAWSWLVAASMTGDDLLKCFQSGDWSNVLTGTQFGRLWMFRATVSLVLGIILWAFSRTSGRRDLLLIFLAGLAVIELVSLAWAGHATASPGPPGVVHLLADALHLLASAFWPGALAPLAAFLLQLFNARQIEAIELAAPIVRRFSASSLIAAGSLALTGLSNSIFMVGGIRALLTTTYGQILLSKLVLFSSMICIGAWNLFVLKPRLAVDLATVDLVRQRIDLRSLLQNVLWEIGLGTTVVLIVGWLGITPPPVR
jgi:copper resistance protein D